MDVKYCGVDQKKIKTAHPQFHHQNLKYFAHWVQERYRIHLKKDILKQDPPWTDDPVLANYRFTNVFRFLDKESKWLIKHIANGKLGYENKLLNCILFRLFNKHETLELIGLQNFSNLNIDKLQQDFAKAPEGYKFFSGAFYTSGPKLAARKYFGSDIKIALVKMVDEYRRDGIIGKIRDSSSQAAVYGHLIECPGIGEFLAYQIFVDFTYIEEFPFTEDEFTIAGPGCKKGIDLICTNRDGLTYEELLFWIRDHQDELLEEHGYARHELFTDQPPEKRILNVMALENCMCEISKYIRAKTNTGRPRVRYKATQ